MLALRTRNLSMRNSYIQHARTSMRSPKTPKKALNAPQRPRKGQIDDQVNGNSCWQGKHANIKTCHQVMSTITQLPLLFFYCDGTSDRPKSFTLLQAERCQHIKDWKILLCHHTHIDCDM